MGSIIFLLVFGTSFLFVIGTSIWVLCDAKSIGVKKGQVKGLADMGPGGWFFGCLLLWIIGFPLYLAKRSEFKKIAQMQGPSTEQPNQQMQTELQAQRIREGERNRQMETQLELQREQIRQLQQQISAPPAPPRPPPAPPPVPAQPVRAVSTQFKFSCPHCGQHISATTDYVGTAGSCPTCNNEFTVPSPSA